MTVGRSLIIAGFDSALKFADRLGDALGRHGSDVTIVAPTTIHPHQLSGEQMRSLTSIDVVTLPWADMIDRASAADIVVPVYDGSRIDQVVRELHDRGGDRMPVIGAGYIGMVLYNSIHGYLWRSLADVVAVNSRQDFSEFQAAGRALGLPTENLLLTGLSLLPARPKPTRGGTIKRVLFADQPTVPELPSERAYIYDRLRQYAEQHPDREVVVKPRHKPGEATFHEMRYAPEEYFDAVAVPTNFHIDHTPVKDQLVHTDLVLSVSSTAILEAIAEGCQVAFVADFFGETFLNHKFVDSGLLRTFDAISADDIGVAHKSWLGDVFPSQDGLPPAEVFARRLIELVDSSHRPHAGMWRHPVQRARNTAITRGEELAASLKIPSPTEAKQSTAERALRRLLRPLPRRVRDRVVTRVRRVLR